MTKMKNVLIISTSPRKEGNSEILADEFGKTEADNANQVLQQVLAVRKR
jgi:hypothetical protein